MDEADTSSGDGEDGFLYDVGAGGSGGPVDSCVAIGDGGPPTPCVDQAPPDSFEPDVQWAWDGQGGETRVVMTPVVANLTDDNEDGEIDLCDVPDVVVVAYEPSALDTLEGHLYVLDGANGEVHFRYPEPVANRSTPALGDIDGDGLVEIITVTMRAVEGSNQVVGRLLALNHDGSVLWEGDSEFPTWCSPALADVDNDGDVEILCKGLTDHEGTFLFESSAGLMVDLDGDQDLELLTGGSAYHHDGSLAWESELWGAQDVAVANLDEDEDPEILGLFINSGGGLAILEHDGTVARSTTTLSTSRPAAIHDVDGDGAADLLVPYPNRYDVMTPDFTVKWSQPVQEGSGFAGSTAFDFLGDGSAEAIYADETTLFAWDGQDGTVRMTAPRSSWTFREYPTVVDVDNDGSAEILVTSNEGYEGQSAPAVQAIRDVGDRWVPARRIWNQHTYHVTNVNEDGSIPQFEAPHWKQLNTFRTQAQIASGSGGTCIPEPEG